MRVVVLFFGVLKELLSGSDETVELPEGAAVGDLLVVLRERTSNIRMEEPAWSRVWESLAVAVNREYAAASVVLHDGDEVALLPPVSGGCCAHGDRRAALAETTAFWVGCR